MEKQSITSKPNSPERLADMAAFAQRVGMPFAEFETKFWDFPQAKTIYTANYKTSTLLIIITKADGIIHSFTEGSHEQLFYVSTFDANKANLKRSKHAGFFESRISDFITKLESE